MLPVPVPLLQIALGALIHFADFTPVALDPEVFFVLLLPPLLFIDGWRIPKDELLRNAPTVLRLALGLVVFTVLGLGLLVHWMIPARWRVSPGWRWADWRLVPPVPGC